MTSCPVCYETYCLDTDALNPRKLSCGDVVCAGCILNDIFDECYYCPECGSEHHGTTLDEFSILVTTVQGDGDVSNDESGDHTDNEDSFGSFNMKATAQTPRSICKYPDCRNKAISNGVCLTHAKHRHRSVSEVDLIAQNMAKTSLNFVSTNGNRLQTMGASRAIGPDDLLQRFKAQEKIELGEAMEIIDRAKDIMFREPNILNLDAPIITVGDIHGQFYDLLNMLEEGGKPGTAEKYLFLGDYVDRGSFSCEVMFYLLSLKIKFPDRIWLLRGNHECASVSGHFGFKEECKMKYGVNVYYKFLLLFQTMPLGAVISTAYGDIFACHGGLSPSFKTIEDVGEMYRFVEPENEAGLLDILWSDPLSEEGVEDLGDEEYESFMNVDWKANPARGCSYCFGYKAIREFLDKNNLVCIVRAHEVQEEGFKKHFDPAVVESRIKRLMKKRIAQSGGAEESKITVGEVDFPPLITIFSAPNYCDRYQNKAAILRIDMALDDFRVIQYDCVEHPIPEIQESQTDNYILAIIAACPYMPTSFRNFVRMAIELGPEEEQNLIGDEEEEEEVPASEAKVDLNRSSNSASPNPALAVAVDDQTVGSGQGLTLDTCSSTYSADILHSIGASLVTDGDSFSKESSAPNSALQPTSLGATPVAVSGCSTPKRGLGRSTSLQETHTASLVRGTPRRESETDIHPINPDEETIEKFLLAHPVPNKVARKASMRFDSSLLGTPQPGTADGEQGSSRRPSYQGSSARPKKRESVVISMVRSNSMADGNGSDDDDIGEITEIGPLSAFSSDDESSKPPLGHSLALDSLPSSVTARKKSKTAMTPTIQPSPAVDDYLECRNLFSSPSLSNVNLNTPNAASNPSMPLSLPKSSLSSLFSSLDCAEVPEEEPKGISNVKSTFEVHSTHPHSGPSDSGLPPRPTKEHTSTTIPVGSHGQKKLAPKRGSLTYTKSEAYMEAMASDSINEIHPEKLFGFMKGTKDINSASSEVDIEREKNLTLFKLAQKELPQHSVAELKNRFEQRNQQQNWASKRPTPINVDNAKDAREFWTSGKQRQQQAKVDPVELGVAARVCDIAPVNRKMEVDALAKSARVASMQAKFGGSVRASTRLSFTRDNESDANVGEPSTESHPTPTRPVSLPERATDSKSIKALIQLHNQHHHANLHLDGSRSNPTSPMQQSAPSSSSSGSSTSSVSFESNNDKSNSSIQSSSDSNIHPPPHRANTDSELIRKGDNDNNSEDSIRSRLGLAKKRVSVVINNDDDFGDETITAESESVFDDVAISPTKGSRGSMEVGEEENGHVLFSQMEILALKLMFSLFDRSGSLFIAYEDLVAYAEETDDFMAIREAALTLDIVDIDGDGKIGLLDFIHFAARLKAAHERRMEQEDNHSEISN